MFAMARSLFRLRFLIAVLLLVSCGTTSGAISSPASDQIRITEAYRVLLAPNGTLVIPAGHSNRVLRFDPSTKRVTVIAGTGNAEFQPGPQPAPLISIGLPRDAAVEADGSVLIALDSDRVVRVDAKTQRVRVIAGTGEKGYSGDGGPADAARLDDPLALAVDPTGNIFIAEAGNRIRRIDHLGNITTVAGTGSAGSDGIGGPAAKARINQPHGLVASPDGSVYIADTGNNRICKLEPYGTISIVDAGEVNTPTGVALAPDGTILVADFMNSRVQRIQGDTASTLVDSVAGVTGIVAFADGTLYVSILDSGLVEVKPDGRRTRVGR